MPARDNTLPRTFTDGKKLVHAQWPKDGIHGIVTACGLHLALNQHWERQKRPITCLVCATRSR